ncbi:cytochrome P450 94B3-like [Chenopodium quinoa]|uniref:cytochrome P450 94B3-like n=1 Tax=Chenopodium quinoa TaxID=63459 RepID=UPI000B76E72E|nr:cytochrome P450 94B3-like [Chenopodium quinoa]
MSFNPFDLFIFFSFFLFIFAFIYFLFLKSKPPSFSIKHSNTTIAHGPPSYPIIGCLISFYKNRKRLLNWYTDLLSESSTQTIVVSRLGERKVIVTANPKNVEYILKTNFSNFPKGQSFTEVLGDLLGNGIFNVDGELWANQRKLASHEFTTKSLREFVVRILEEEVDARLIPLLQLAAHENRIIDLQEILKRFTYDSICKVSLGIDPKCLDLSNPTPPIVTAFESAAEISAKRSASPINVIWKLKRILNLGSEQQLKQSLNILHNHVSDIICTKKESLANSKESENHDLLSRFLFAGYDGNLARDMVISFIMAGRDTTAAAMTWLFWLLSSVDLGSRERIRDELTSGIDLSSGPLRYEILKKELKYLHACICEAMRLYPPVAWDSKHAINNDVLPDGTKVSKGDRVTYFPYGMGRMQAIWGKDYIKFKPDRWFESQTDDKSFSDNEKDRNNHARKLKMVNPYEFPVFQAGPRVCLGKEMAFIQMKYVIASIISRFNFEPVNCEHPIFMPLLTSQMDGGLKVRVKEIIN